MIDLQKSITFLLGAGASAPYGFPLGKELKATILNTLTDRVCLETLGKLGFNEDLIAKFIYLLEGTDHVTLDRFLEKQKSYRSVGAHFIAHVLLGKEQPKKEIIRRRDCYAPLYDLLAFDHPNENERPNISIVTLNYERSLEHYLDRKIDSNCDENHKDLAYERFERLPIIHPHGSLGTLNTVPFGANNSDEQLLTKAAEGIRIISDKLDDAEEFKAARRVIENSSQIIFLGFGFDRRTVELLFKNNGIASDERELFASGFGLSADVRQSVSEFFANQIDFGKAEETAHAFLERLVIPGSGFEPKLTWG